MASDPPPADAERKAHIAQGDAEARIDGLFREPRTDAIFQAYISGEIEVTAIVARLHILLGL